MGDKVRAFGPAELGRHRPPQPLHDVLGLPDRCRLVLRRRVFALAALVPSDPPVAAVSLGGYTRTPRSNSKTSLSSEPFAVLLIDLRIARQRSRKRNVNRGIFGKARGQMLGNRSLRPC